MSKTIYSIIELALSTILIIVGVFAIINIDLIKDFIFAVMIGYIVIRILLIIFKHLTYKIPLPYTIIQVGLNTVIIALLCFFRESSEILSYVVLFSCACDLIINIVKSILYRKTKDNMSFYGLDDVICALFIVLLIVNRESEVITTAVLFGCLVFYKGIINILSNVLVRKLFTLNDFIKTINKVHAIDVLFGLIIVLMLTSFILPCVEPNITNIGDAWWYCFAVITTIGFGDLTAVTLTGRILTVIIGFYGIIIVSLITSSTVVYITSENKKSQ